MGIPELRFGGIGDEIVQRKEQFERLRATKRGLTGSGKRRLTRGAVERTFSDKIARLGLARFEFSKLSDDVCLRKGQLTNSCRSDNAITQDKFFLQNSAWETVRESVNAAREGQHFAETLDVCFCLFLTLENTMALLIKQTDLLSSAQIVNHRTHFDTVNRREILNRKRKGWI